MSDRIIVAESETEEQYLRIPDLTPEEEKELEERAKENENPKSAGITPAPAPADAPTPAPEEKTLPEEAEPLFTEITAGEDVLKELARIDEETASVVLSASEIFNTCVLPEKTELQEHLIKTKNDVLIGDHATIGYGIYGNDVVICELCELFGDVVAEGDLRIDNFCEVHGTVICNGDAYLGEGVKIHGKLTVGGNLDIGDKVEIEKEFKAYGDIAIRNPMPVILYLLLYVITMLHIEGEEKTNKKLAELVSEANTTPLVLPPKTNMDLAQFAVPTPMEIGANCRLHGNLKAQSVKMLKDTTLFGSIRAVDRIKIGPRDAIHGDVAGARVRVERGADILGDVTGKTVWLHEDAHVSGLIRADEGLTIGRSET
ncbi:MAG TPA: acyltransferase [Methanocorpusculum sp.]|nr:acyltransferase [Methanocorpusculum sp.]